MFWKICTKNLTGVKASAIHSSPYSGVVCQTGKSLVLGIALLALFCVRAHADKPNVIVIYTDDQGYGDASCLNPDAKFQTPNLDRLAREGVTFTDAHCSDTVCTPSRYGLLTGRYSWRTTLKRGVFGAEKECLIADGRMTLASLLRDNGYHTAMVGKWHLGMDFPGDWGDRDWTKPVQDMPLDKGFDYFWGIPASMNYGVLAWFDGRYAKVPPTEYTQKKPNRIAISDYRIKPEYDKSPPANWKKGEPAPKSKLEVASDFVDSECLTRFTNKAIDWIQSKSADAREGKPFFLYLPYTSPHKPVIPIPEFRGKSEAGAYGDFMIETDAHVGRILDLLDQEKLTDNTLIVFTSDNGPETTWRERIRKFDHHSNGIYREGKRSIYEGGHRVPFFVRWPVRAMAGVQCTKPICQTDVLATLAEVVGANLPDHAAEDSVSFLSSLTDENASKERLPIIHHSAQGGFAIRDGDWKLVMAFGKKQQQKELYNLARDPSEKSDVANQNPNVVKRLTDKITGIVRNGRTTDGKPQSNDTPWWDALTWMQPW